MAEADPWSAIEPPAARGTVFGKRVDASGRWDFWWAKDVDNHCLLILQHAPGVAPKNRLPKFRGVEIRAVPGEGTDRGMLVLSLAATEHREIFHRLCLDVIQSASSAVTEAEAIQAFLGRTWRWHHLLRGGADGRLSAEAQKGLAGEITFIDRHLLPLLSPHDAVSAWTGPLDAPKDFEIGQMAIETKARRGAAKPWIAISSEFQLDDSGLTNLYLYVLEVDAAPEATANSVTITDVARGLRDRIVATDPAVEHLFEERLQASGFSWEHDYRDRLWLIGKARFFEVAEGFPRIVPSDYPSGVENVRYAISLKDCEPHRVTDESVTGRLEEVRDGHES